MIQGNPDLKPGAAPARVILNEVKSNNPSQLRGYLEVAGGRAQVIVANLVCGGQLGAGRGIGRGDGRVHRAAAVSGCQA
ncbi:filamentous hemagglutinin N-terminal domain-containing protein [Pantoea deleyi]|uniref:Filamentous hemagglutinin N-terminal domain-containing protein n=1 Tax=Pantoea deleyi TaxID=470932 RepID=A0A506PU11_9GAMM|nr:filamentous hemagglutinin N-terminal domain-containing protein [Pantoea deleyi]TPV37009.1 filamentous hemagglutinin N-terminal domain-containing protein [Pantoea deleyi]